MAYDRLVGDYGQSVIITIPASVNLTSGAPSAHVYAQKPDAAHTKLELSPVTLDTGARTATYVWESGDLDVSGKWTLQLEIRRLTATPAERVRSDPFVLTVGPGVAP